MVELDEEEREVFPVVEYAQERLVERMAPGEAMSDARTIRRGLMRAIDRLKRDHKILRTKLGVLEAGVKMGPDAWFVLREVSYSLARQLRDHIRREEALVAECRTALNADALQHIAVEHRDEPERLRTVSRLFVQEPGRTLAHVAPVLEEVVTGLRRHMEEEETDLFPILERVLASREQAQELKGEESPDQFHEAMTVNRIIQQFPRTRPVFERLFINLPYEGCDCLDEVAWRHGMESRELLAKLDKVFGNERPASSEGRRPEVRERR